MTDSIFSYNDPASGAVERLERLLLSGLNSSRRLLLNLDSLPVLDNAALRGLIRLLRRVRESGGTLVLCVTRPEHRSVLRLTALDRVFEVAAC